MRARALLCPVGSSKGQPLPMQYRSLSIGTGSEVDLCLTDYGHCNHISSQHAHIFYDEVSIGSVVLCVGVYTLTYYSVPVLG